MKNELKVFENSNIRSIYDEVQEKWYFSIEDIVKILTDSVDPKGYIKKLRKRDIELSEGWGQIVTPLKMQTAGGPQKVNCADIKGIFRIIQSIPSKKAEPIKQWLAKVGQERIQEMSDPSTAIDRARETYKQLGRSEKWIQQRMTGQETRNKLTDYWANHDITESEEFAILTNIIHQEWSGLSVKEHKNLKGLKSQNLRDHMSEAELIFTALAELSTRQVAENTEATGMKENTKAAQIGGNIAKRAKDDFEERTGQKVITSDNYLSGKNPKQIKNKD